MNSNDKSTPHWETPAWILLLLFGLLALAVWCWAEILADLSCGWVPSCMIGSYALVRSKNRKTVFIFRSCSTCSFAEYSYRNLFYVIGRMPRSSIYRKMIHSTTLLMAYTTWAFFHLFEKYFSQSMALIIFVKYPYDFLLEVFSAKGWIFHHVLMISSASSSWSCLSLFLTL